MCLRDHELDGLAVQQSDRTVIWEFWLESSGFRALYSRQATGIQMSAAEPRSAVGRAPGS